MSSKYLVARVNYYKDLARASNHCVDPTNHIQRKCHVKCAFRVPYVPHEYPWGYPPPECPKSPFGYDSDNLPIRVLRRGMHNYPLWDTFFRVVHAGPRKLAAKRVCNSHTGRQDTRNP